MDANIHNDLRVGKFSLSPTLLCQFKTHDENKKRVQHLKWDNSLYSVQTNFEGFGSTAAVCCSKLHLPFCMLCFLTATNSIIATYNTPQLHHTEDESSNVASTALRYSHEKKKTCPQQSGHTQSHAVFRLLLVLSLNLL